MSSPHNYQDSLKSKDTEEFLDLIFYRPLGYRWALFFEKYQITPNAVSVMSIFLGVTAGILFYFTNIWLTLLGIFFLVWANVYDSADGQLARMTKQFSPIGRILDGLSGDLWFITIYIAICMRVSVEWQAYIWILGALAGFWHIKQAALADYYRNLHLHFLQGKIQSEFSTTTSLKTTYENLSFKEKPVEKTFAWLYLNYTGRQEKMTPCLQRLMQTLDRLYPHTVPPSDFVENFLEQSRPLMKYTNILTFNTRALALFVSLLIGMPWIYFVFELVILNLILLYMYMRHEQMCTRFTHELENAPL